MTVQEKTVTLQVDFKEGKLRTIEEGDRSVTAWDRVPGKKPKFTFTSRKNGASLSIGNSHSRMVAALTCSAISYKIPLFGVEI